MNYINLDFEKHELTFSIKKEYNTISKHTGNTLEKKEICLNTDKQTHENVINKYQKKEIISIDENGKKIKKWKINNSSISIINEKYSYYFTIEEIEKLDIENLIIGDINIKPYFYKEWFSDDALCIDAKANITDSQFEKINKMLIDGGSYEVIRKGINEKPYNMRLGTSLWSKNDSAIKYKFPLRGEKYFKSSKNPLGELFVRIGNISVLILKQKKMLNDLLSILLEKNIVKKDELIKIKDISNQEINDKLIDLYRVKDLDNY